LTTHDQSFNLITHGHLFTLSFITSRLEADREETS